MSLDDHIACGRPRSANGHFEIMDLGKGLFEICLLRECVFVSVAMECCVVLIAEAAWISHVDLVHHEARANHVLFSMDNLMGLYVALALVAR